MKRLKKLQLFVLFISFFVLTLGMGLSSDYVAEGTEKNKPNEYYDDGSLKTEYLVFDDAGNALEYINYTGAKGRFAKLHHRCSYDDSGYVVVEYIILDDGFLWQIYKSEYDDNGYLVLRKCFYEENGNPVAIMEYERDSDGRCIRQINHDLLTGEKDETYYDTSEKAIRQTIYNSSGTVDYHVSMTYDSEDRLIECKMLNIEGNVNFSQVYQYDTQGRVIHSQVLSNLGELIIDTNYEYTENGCIETEQFYYDFDKECIITEYNDNIIVSRKHYDEDRTLEYTEMMEYDDNWNCISIKAYYTDGTEKHHIDCTYNARGIKTEQIRFYADGSKDILRYNDYGICITDETRSASDSLIYETLHNNFGDQVMTRFFSEESGEIYQEIYYNEHGSDIRRNIYEGGKLVYYVQYEYDENNNKISETEVYCE